MADHDPNHGKHDHGVRPYIIVALILGVITYVEFAIIEYEVPFLGDGATMFWLIALSLVKFVLVILFFMHLKGDDPAYSGFFGSGMVIALGTFVAFWFLMFAPASLDLVRAGSAPDGRFVHGETADDGHGDEHAIDEATASSIESDGYSRDLGAVLGDGRPRDGTLAVTPPAADDGDWTLAESAPATDEAAGDANAQADEAPEPAAGDAEPDGGQTDAAPTAQADAGAWDEELGASVYGANCTACHQATGQGIPGAFPPLAGHAPDIVAADGGRAYLIDVLLYGLQGQIQVSGTSYNGVMPAWAQLSDDELAAVANHVLYAWDDGEGLPDGFAPIAADEVADARGQGLTGQDVHALRDGLGLP